MVNIQKFGDSAIKFTFTDNDRYLYDGEITVPLNSLILVLDESDMAVFKKIDGDVFLAFLIENSNFSTKAELETFYKENMVGSTGGGGGGGVTSGWVENYVEDALVPYAESSAVTEEISEAVSGKADTSDVQNIASNVATVSGNVNALSGSVNTLTGNVNALSGDVANKADTTAVTASITAAVSGKADASDVYTKTEGDDALDDKQDTLSAGTGISIVDNVISATGGGGGGKAIVAGTNISVTTGETADTVNCTLPITASNNNRCIITGTEQNKGSAEGMGTYESFITGRQNKATNYAEAAFGRYNRSNHKSDTFGDSGNTLFSVGNGTGIFTSDRHNAFEIRQNGDIYITKDGADVLLQDELGGGISPEDVQDMIDSSLSDYTDSGTVQSMIDSSLSDYTDTTVQPMIDECASQADIADIQTELSAITATTDRIERVTATALNDLNAKLGGMKLVQLTQAQYDALTVKDPQTLYFITNVVN